MPSPWPLSVVALTPVSCGAALWRMDGALRATVIVKATFGLAHERDAWLVAPGEIVRRDHHRDACAPSSLDEAAETAPFLPGAGVVLHGHAYAPAGEPVTATTARLTLFREGPLLEKVISVFGDRASPAVSPAPFQRMPIVYERAYGAPEFELNPVGVGAGDDATPPNLVDPVDPLRPAGFGPISRYWPARRRLLSAVARSSLDRPIPELPRDFDWRYYHAAPEDQRVDFLQGDEWILLDGLHPTLPRVQTRLPSARGRARWTGPGASALAPIDLSADTLVIDADRQRCAVIWRGHFVVEREDALASVRVFAGVELRGEPIAWPLPETIALDSKGLEIERALAERGPSGIAPPPQPVAPASRYFHSNREDAPPIRPKSDPPPPPPIAELRGPDDYDPAVGVTAPELLSALQGSWPEPAGEDQAPAGAAPGAPGSAPSAAASRAAIAAGLEAGESFDDRNLSGADLSGLDFSGRSLLRCNLRGATLARCVFTEANLAGAQLGTADLTEAALVDADLTRANLTRAVLSRATLDGAILVETNLSAAQGEGASFRGARGQRTIFARGSWRGASFEGMDVSQADFTAAILDGAGFQGASLVEIRLSDARGADVTFNDARMPRARADGATLERSSLTKIDAPSSIWEKATLTGSTFQGANLKGASFVRAACAGADFYGADLSDGRLRQAEISGATFATANLKGVKMQRVTGDAPELRGANLDGADLRQARLINASFVEVTMRKGWADNADLTGCRFTGADLRKSSFRAATLRSANLTRTQLDAADLRDADLERANVYGAARQGTKMSGASTKDLLDVDPDLPVRS